MQQLGIFPSFMYSDDPAINPLLNPHVTFPPGMMQTTAQPPGAYYGTRGTALGGFKGFSSVGAAVSSIGLLLVLTLAGYGGWSFYKKHIAKGK